MSQLKLDRSIEKSETILQKVAQGAKPKKRRRPWVLASLGGAGLLILFLIALRFAAGRGGDASSVGGELTYKVTRGELLISFMEKGNIRAAKSVQIFNQLEGLNTIVSLVPEGTFVKEGDLLVELDSSELSQSLNQQQIQFDTAESAYSQAVKQLEIQKSLSQSDLQQAKVTLELAQIDLEKYKDGDFEVAQKKAESDKIIAEQEQARAQNQCEWTEKLAVKGYVTGTELIADKLAVTKARLQLEQANRALEVLKKYTSKKDLKKFELDLQLAKAALERTGLKTSAEEAKLDADAAAKKSSLAHYKKRLKKVQDEFEKTKILAPQGGMVVYANTEPWRRERIIEKGAQVHENQVLLTLPDVSTMAVDVQVHESWIDQVHEGLAALASIDALPNLNLRGKVSKVGLLPDSVNRWMNPDLKVYLTELTLEESSDIKLLRPGMSAKVQVIIQLLKDVLFVPVQSVSTVDKQQVCYVLEGGDFVPRTVQGGKYNESFIEISSGLKVGEIIQLNAPAPQGAKQMKEADDARAAIAEAQRIPAAAVGPDGGPGPGLKGAKDGDSALRPPGAFSDPPTKDGVTSTEKKPKKKKRDADPSSAPSSVDPPKGTDAGAGKPKDEDKKKSGDSQGGAEATSTGGRQ